MCACLRILRRMHAWACTRTQQMASQAEFCQRGLRAMLLKVENELTLDEHDSLPSRWAQKTERCQRLATSCWAICAL